MQFEKYSEKSADHEENEDFTIYAKHPSDGNRFIGFIADGQGGREDGAKASRLACEHAIEYASNTPWSKIQKLSYWDELIVSVDLTVRENCNGFTTFIGFSIDKFMLMGTSVGDSKLYFSNDEGTSEVTHHQRKNPPIGGGCNGGTSFSVATPKGQFLAATDGVWKFCGFERIEESLRSDISQTKEIILPPCRLASGNLPDDFTFIACSTRG